MRITKLEHAALIVEDGGRRLVVDPGSFTRPIEETGVVAVVVTHEHADHWTPEQLTRILTANPDAVVYGPAGVRTAAAAAGIEVHRVEADDEVDAGGFALRFFGGRHAVIHSSIPVIDNLGVLVDDTLYYPGDSFTVPEGVDVQALATPASAPWLKVGEIIDFVLAVAPRLSFPAHECINSDAGNALANSRIDWATREGDGTFVPLTPGDSIEV